MREADLLWGAIAAAQDELSDALQSDLEHGVRWLNEKAAAEFKAKYPALNAWIGKFMSTADTSSDTSTESRAQDGLASVEATAAR